MLHALHLWTLAICRTALGCLTHQWCCRMLIIVDLSFSVNPPQKGDSTKDLRDSVGSAAGSGGLPHPVISPSAGENSFQFRKGRHNPAHDPRFAFYIGFWSNIKAGVYPHDPCASCSEHAMTCTDSELERSSNIILWYFMESSIFYSIFQ